MSPYGYIALIGETKMSIYLAYAEEETCTYDHIWTITFWDYRDYDIGSCFEVIDFSQNCEEFVAYTNNEMIVTFDIKNMEFGDECATLKWSSQCPVTQLRSFMNNTRCIAFSKPNNLIMILDLSKLSELPDEERKS